MFRTHETTAPMLLHSPLAKLPFKRQPTGFRFGISYASEFGIIRSLYPRARNPTATGQGVENSNAGTKPKTCRPHDPMTAAAVFKYIYYREEDVYTSDQLVVCFPVGLLYPLLPTCIKEHTHNELSIWVMPAESR